MKTKTKTKTFYVSYLGNLNEESHNAFFLFLKNEKTEIFNKQVQISWSEPDREVTIKESKFGEIIGEYPLDTNEVSSLIEKLFGAEK